MELTFNAKGTENQNWFSDSKLTHSSQWYDIKKESRNYFSISGDTAKKRHFFINRGYAGNCNGDTGWMVIAGKECNWEKGHRHKHPILYSKLSKYTKWAEKSEFNNTLCFYDFNFSFRNVSFLSLLASSWRRAKRQKGIEFIIGILSYQLFPLVGKSEGVGEEGCGRSLCMGLITKYPPHVKTI